MKFASIVSAILLSVAFLSCQAPSSLEAQGSYLSFRPEVAAGADGAIAYHGPDGSWQAIWLDAERSFDLSYVGKTLDSRGNAAIVFEIAPHDQVSFSDLTESIIGKHLAILIDGEIISAPVVVDRLPGEGIIQNGMQGFTQEEATAMVTALRIGGNEHDV